MTSAHTATAAIIPLLLIQLQRESFANVCSACLAQLPITANVHCTTPNCYVVYYKVSCGMLARNLRKNVQYWNAVASSSDKCNLL
jgi:hypothetical protein